MENHHLSAHQLTTKKQAESALPKQSPIDKIPKLGGIYLYNQGFKRHLHIQTNERSHKANKSAATNSEPLASAQQQFQVDKEICDYLHNRDQHKFTVSSLFTSEIEGVIQKFKTSHLTTNRFLEQHQSSSEQIDQGLFSFQQLLECEKIKNRDRYNCLMQKIKHQFKQVVAKEVAKIRLQEASKARQRHFTKRDFGVQSLFDFQHELAVLKKQIERKDAEYKALYEYKKDMINEGQANIKNYQIRCQFQKALISKLQSQMAAKNLEIKTLQSQTKHFQDKLFTKMLEVQRLLAISQTKSVSSIQQITNPTDLIRQNEAISSFLSRLNSKKKRFKQRAESILSVTHSLFSNLKDKDDIIASMADIASKSMREIDVHFDKEIDDQFIQQLQRASKNSSDAHNLFRILEFYKKSKNNRSSIQKLHKRQKGKVSNIQKTAQRNSFQTGAKVDKEYFRGSFRKDDPIKPRNSSKDSKQKASEHKTSFKKQESKSQIKAGKQLQPTNQSLKSKFLNRKLSFQKVSETPQFQIVTKPLIKEEKISILKHSSKELSVVESKNEDNVSNMNQSSQNEKKLKKGVSFQVERHRPYLCAINSRQVDILINHATPANPNAFRQLKKQPTGGSIHLKANQENQQSFDKHRFSKNKLVKTRLKDQVHKKVNSTLNSQVFESLPYGSSNEKPAISQASQTGTFYGKSPLQRQQQRFSCHNSQQGKANLSKRSSYSRLQRVTFNNCSAVSSPAEDEQEAKVAKQMALKSKSKAQYKKQLAQLHRGCAEDCGHIRKYLQFFDKCREGNRKENMRLRVQNLNDNISGNLPTLGKAGK